MIPQTLGIDFGTSNTAAAVMAGDQPWLVPVEDGQTTLPTSVFFDYQRKVTTYGSVANTALIDGREGRYMRALKSVLGTPLMREKRQIAYDRLTLIEVVARFLATIKQRAENATGLTFQHALSGRPVRFHSTDDARNAQAEVDLAEAYRIAGFASVEFMFEPEAAALASGAIDTGTRGLIVDIGGGTSDFSVFERDGDQTHIIASHGVRVGGTDFDKALSLAHVMPLFGRGADIRNDIGNGTYTAPNVLFNDLAAWEKIPFLYSAETRRMTATFAKMGVDPDFFVRLHEVLEMELGHDVAFAVEAGKIRINEKGVTTATIDLGMVARDLAAPFSGDDLTAALADHAQSIRNAVDETLNLAGLVPSQIGTVVFVGGSSLMQMVEGMMAGLFPNARLERTSAFTAVASGLAIAAAAADRKRNACP